jgi:hypothetical protein
MSLISEGRAQKHVKLEKPLGGESEQFVAAFSALSTSGSNDVGFSLIGEQRYL